MYGDIHPYVPIHMYGDIHTYVPIHMYGDIGTYAYGCELMLYRNIVNVYINVINVSNVVKYV